MENIKIAEAGSCDAGDILIRVYRNDNKGICIELDSKPVILKQYGRQMRDELRRTAEAMGVTDVTIHARDNGSLNYVIRARLQAALEQIDSGEECG